MPKSFSDPKPLLSDEGPKSSSLKNRLIQTIVTSCLFRKTKYCGAFCQRHPITTSSIFLILLVAIIFMLVTCAPTCILAPTYYNPISRDYREKQFNVILFGDSLLTGNHEQHFAIFPLVASKISSFIPNFNLNLMNFGHQGDGVSALQHRLNAVLSTPADAIVILWDSDVSANRETPSTMNYLRHTYISNVTSMVKAIRSNNSEVLIALAGPIIIGEGTLFMKISEEEYYEKIIMLNDYKEINQKIAADLNISYIDIRSAFLEHLPFYRLSYMGCLTLDGEHENENGMTIIAKSVATKILDWASNSA